ncbi:Hypothetical predicted protein [Mytilus galloprovincialis]|uniref:Uncharacterized protein n=1 Tax=Mytilus galloprovincialis TaxID=29158 RepID=A0A8B6EVF7_MYTGA|nr:Hypothetical predicted protein [Mytilus galloprovincialis]
MDIHFEKSKSYISKSVFTAVNITSAVPPDSSRTDTNLVTDDATVVFDGYPSVPTTKDVTHFSRTKGIISPKVNFNNDTPIKTKKDEFLSNSENKQHFINTLGEKLKDGHVQVIHAEDDADLKIVHTAIEKSKQHTTTVIGEDTS